MDIVFIEGLKVDTTIGVYDWEKVIKQTLILDIEMKWDNRLAAQTDNVNDCLNYQSVGDSLVTFLAENQFQLVERVAEDVAALILRQFLVTSVKVKVMKPSALPYATQVGVIIERLAAPN